MSEANFRVSSSTTLIFNLFIPTVWIVFFGSFVLLIIIMGGNFSPVFYGILPRVILLLCYLVFLFFIARTLLRLKRVELTPDHFYVTNYFKTFRYQYEDLKRITEIDFLIMRFIVFRFKEKSSFGRRIFFIKRGRVWREFIETYPEILQPYLAEE